MKTDVDWDKIYKPLKDDVIKVLDKAKTLDLHKVVIISETTDGETVLLSGGSANNNVHIVWLLERIKLCLMSSSVWKLEKKIDD